MCYCMAPAKWNGSITIYNKIIRPLFLKHQKKVDEALDKAANVAKDVIDEGIVTINKTMSLWLF